MCICMWYIIGFILLDMNMLTISRANQSEFQVIYGLHIYKQSMLTATVRWPQTMIVRKYIFFPTALEDMAQLNTGADKLLNEAVSRGQTITGKKRIHGRRKRRFNYIIKKTYSVNDMLTCTAECCT